MPCADARERDGRWQAVLRRRFDRAAPVYQELALAQRQSADELLDDLRALTPQGRVLDLGCGSGYLARLLVQEAGVREVLALDLSEGMLSASGWQSGSFPSLHRICADAAALPLAAGSIDVLVSNFALHWCPQPTALLRELRRVVSADAVACLVIPVAGSLAARGAAVGASLRPLADWRQAAVAAGWSLHTDALVSHVEFHAAADAWLQALRAIGVTARRGTGLGLAGRSALTALRERLEATRESAGIPLRYQAWRVTLRPA